MRSTACANQVSLAQHTEDFLCVLFNSRWPYKLISIMQRTKVCDWKCGCLATLQHMTFYQKKKKKRKKKNKYPCKHTKSIG